MGAIVPVDVTSEQIKEFILGVYKIYPKKLGKSLGIKKLTSGLKTKRDCEDLCIALSKFLAHHQEVETKPQYLPYFSTFVSSWMDWLDDDTGTVLELGKNYSDLLDF